MMLNAQAAKAGPPMDGRDLNIGDMDWGVLPAAAPLTISTLNAAGLALAFQRLGEARVAVWPGMNITTRIRLRGIDAPELKAMCADEFRRAELAADALDRLLREGNVVVYNVGPDKYEGRVDADVATSRTPNVSAALLAGGYARAYDGGHRDGWCGEGR